MLLAAYCISSKLTLSPSGAVILTSKGAQSGISPRMTKFVFFLALSPIIPGPVTETPAVGSSKGLTLVKWFIMNFAPNR